MTTVYVLQTGQTAWESEARVESATGSPLTDAGSHMVQDAARELVDHDIRAVYACTRGEAERQTAELAAKELQARIRANEDLHELDYGLWQGLTFEEIKRRQPRAYRQWMKAPGSFRPPEGETLAEASERLRSALKNITRKHRGGAALLVLRPTLVALLKCLTEHKAVDSLWEQVDRSFLWGCYEVDGKSL
jgi:broad specificity phosphatase PhoE